MFKKLIFLIILAVVLVFGMAVFGCDDNSENGNGGGGNSVGCSSLSAGTQCTAKSVCSDRFLCLTGQGSDDNCTTGCSCQ
jgi:hypothetical protein